MVRTSCVPRIANDQFLIIRASYVQICKGDVTAAALIHIFEQWHNTKLAAQENHIDMNPDRGEQTPLPPLWQFHKNDDLEAALMGIGKRHSIDQAKKLLSDMGIIEIGRNPNKKYKFDATTFYLFRPEIVTSLLETENRIAENSIDIGAENNTGKVSIGAENSRAIPLDSQVNIESLNTVPAPSRGGTFVVSNDGTVLAPEKPAAPAKAEKKPAAKKAEPKPAKAPRPHWQQLVDGWHDWYKLKHNGEEPNFRGRNPAFFGQLVDLLHGRADKKAKRSGQVLEWTSGYAIKALVYYLELAWSDTWLKGHFLLSNLVDQFDAVYAREALRLQAEKDKKTPPPPTAQTGTEGELQYIRARYKEGNLDPRMITPDIYDKLTGRGYMPVGTMKNFPAPTFEESKVLAVKDWLEKSTKSIVNEPE